MTQVARRLHERGICVFLDRWYLAAGQPWPQELERTLASCGAVAVFLGAEGLGPWQQRERDLALDRQGREPGFPVIPVLLSRMDPPLGFLKFNTWVDLSAGAADDAALEILTAAIRRQPPGPLALQQITAVRTEICPYRGLRPFREEDEPFFFGRTAFTEALATTLARQSFVAVVGASGSGKSSVVRAGLIPRLRRGEDGRIWEAIRFVPTDRPLASLAAALLPLLQADLTEVDRLAEVGKLARHLAEGDVRLRNVTSRILEKQPGTERLLLFVDQWEELYTLCPDEAIRTAFVAQLLEAAQAAAVTVVLTLRGDFYGRALSDRALSDRLQDAVVNIGPMTRAELAETITKPAKKMGLAFEPGLAETILDDIGDEPGSLPLLEFLLEALWKERRGAFLHYDAYQQLGRVAGAIAHRADEVFTRELDDHQRQTAQRLLIRMVRPGEGVEDTRQRAAIPVADPVAEATIRKLADARLVVTERDAANGRETVEMAHEALIRGWQRLRGWVDQNREFLRTRDRIAAQARLWEDEGRPADRLLPPGRPLAEGEDLLATRRADLDTDLLTYVEASTAAAKAEEEAKRAVQHRRLRRARLVSAAMGLFAFVAIGAATIAWWQRGEANRNAEQARAAQAKAEENLILALRMADIGKSAATLATLLRYQYGDPVSEEDILKEMINRQEYRNTPILVRIREGFSFLDLQHYVDRRGYRGVGYGKMTFAGLIKEAPILVPVNIPGDRPRLVVFLGAIKDKVLLADSENGMLTAPRDEFESKWWLHHPNFGRIGFVVAPGDGMTPRHQLGPTASAFIIDFVGFGELLLTTVNGETIGFTEGKYIDQISNAERFDYPDDDRFLKDLLHNLRLGNFGDADSLPERPPDPQPPRKSERRYYFSQDTALTAEVSGIGDGTYDFVKTKGDGIVTFSDVPTADGVKDIISVTDHKFSIKFGIGSRRNGKFYLLVKNDDSLDRLLYGWTQFEASDLPVIPGATFNYRVDWEALRVGEDGVRIEVDENSDGNIDFIGTVGAKLNDAVAPTTTPDLSGTQLSTGSYLRGATLTLIATDNDGGIGVDKTEYSLDNGSNWTTYTAPLIFNEGGEITLAYRSRDGLGNLEATQSMTISIAVSSNPTVHRGGK